MLSNEDNEVLCRVGAGTPMGDLMRQYWIPAIRSDELPAPDCPPVRIKLLGEELIGFRATSGAVGLMQNACPHRGASIFFGRNEEEGLRCVYHGWKFDVTGACVDMPSEPAESNFKNKVRTKAYACRERGGIIWAYMGTRPLGEEPPLPDLEANMLPEGEGGIYNITIPSNWMQNWEGEMDTVHAAFLHGSLADPETMTKGSAGYYQAKNKAPRFSVLETPSGTSYGAYRPAEDDTYYWRIAHMLFPFYAMIPTGTLGLHVFWRAYVPLDDNHTLMWTQVKGPPDRRLTWQPNGTGWYDRFNITQNPENDWLIDRAEQASGRSYTGIPGGARPQDMAVTHSMGPIYDRSREHLGTTDQLIIRTRRRMIAAARTLRENGTLPPGVDEPELYRQRSGGVILPRSVDWWDGTADLRKGFVEHADLKPLVGV